MKQNNIEIATSPANFYFSFKLNLVFKEIFQLIYTLNLINHCLFWKWNTLHMAHGFLIFKLMLITSLMYFSDVFNLLKITTSNTSEVRNMCTSFRVVNSSKINIDNELSSFQNFITVSALNPIWLDAKSRNALNTKNNMKKNSLNIPCISE